MKKTTAPITRLTLALLAAAATILAARSSSAIVYDLTADETVVSMADGTNVTMWAFGLAGDPVTVPGPLLEVPPGDATLTINLTNNLAVPISLFIPGQAAASVPVKFVDGQGRQRARSLTAETAPGATSVYTWSSFKPGTFLYISGTQPQVQVQMGLYGGVKKDAAAGVAYNDNPAVDASFDNEVILFYSEIDPELHAAVADGTYGTPAYPSTLLYNPRYFLINGDTFSGNRLLPRTEPILDHPIAPAERVLIRFLNAGLKTHVPTVGGAYMSVVAEDGNVAPFAEQKYDVHLAALKTMDAILVQPPIGTYPVIDRALHLTDMQGGVGGMLAYLMSGAPLAVDDIYVADKRATASDLPLTVAAPGVFANDTGTGPFQAILVAGPQHGTLTLNADGSFSYAPTLLYVGPDSFTYIASNGALSNVAVANITVQYVNRPPLAVADAVTVRRNRPAVVRVLANDRDVDGGTLNPASVAIAVAARGGTAVANANGTITYTPRRNFVGADSFQYTVSDIDPTAAPPATSLPGRVTVRVLR